MTTRRVGDHSWASHASYDEFVQRWQAGEPRPPVRSEIARAAASRASRFGLADHLRMRHEGEPVPAVDGVHRLVDFAPPGAGSLRTPTQLTLLSRDCSQAVPAPTNNAGGADLRALTAWAGDRTTA